MTISVVAMNATSPPQKAEPPVDVGGEDPEKMVDDACAAHGSPHLVDRRLGAGGCRESDGGFRPMRRHWLSLAAASPIGWLRALVIAHRVSRILEHGR